jgi:hypothetical protein
MKNRESGLLNWIRKVDSSFVKWIGPAGFLLGLLLSIGIGLPAGVDIYRNWQNIEPTQRSQAGITLLQTVFTIVGGVAIFWNVVLSRSQLNATQEQNITDRFSKAVEQLGRESTSVRIGAIYALERISQDSHRDYWPVMEVLSAFIRDKKQWFSGRSEVPVQYERDVQVAVLVIGRRKAYQDPANKALYLNDSDLRGMVFFDDDFSRVRFQRSDLRETNFYRANLTQARFWQACLSGANLSHANLTGATLEEADLHGCLLDNANLHKANFKKAKGLNADQIKAAKNWQTAIYDPAILKLLEIDHLPLS